MLCRLLGLTRAVLPAPLVFPFQRLMSTTTMGIHPPKAPLAPGNTRKSQRGLFHGLKHERGFHITFSFKHTLRMKKPGVVSKWFKSETLGRKFKLFVTNKARRCILKAGGLDEYLLNTKDSTLCSKLGSELKQAIKAKNNDPEMRVPYIASTSSGHISPTKRELRRRHVPSVYVSAQDKLVDPSPYLTKGWAEMTRTEKDIMLRLIDIADEEDVEKRKILESEMPLREEVMQEQMSSLREGMMRLQEKRVLFMKGQLDVHLHKPTQRNYLLKLIAENDKQFKDILGVQSRTFYQDCPEMKQKIAQVEKQELEEKLARSPNRGEKRAFDPFTPERLKLPAIKKVMKIRTGRRRSGPSDERIPI